MTDDSALPAAGAPVAGGVSVIIPTRDRPDDVRAALAPLAAQTAPPLEVLVVDDSADDRTARVAAEFAAAAPFPVRHYAPRTGSLTRARNYGADRAAGEFIAYLDDDAIVRPDYLQRLRDCLLAAGPEYAGGCALWTDNAGYVPLRLPGQREKKFFALGHYGDGRFLANGMPRFPAEQEKLTDTEIISGGYNIIRRDIVRAFRFDERMNGYCVLEDIDFSYRVSRRYKFFYDPQNIVWHLGKHDTQLKREAHARMLMRNYLYYFHGSVSKSAAAYALCAWAIIGLFWRAVSNRVLSQCRGYLRGLWETARSGFAPV